MMHTQITIIDSGKENVHVFKGSHRIDFSSYNNKTVTVTTSSSIIDVLMYLFWIVAKCLVYQTADKPQPK